MVSPVMNSMLFDKIKILFWGIQWSRVDIYRLIVGDVKLVSRIESNNSNLHNKAIVGIEFENEAVNSQMLYEFINNLNFSELSSIYIAVKNKRELQVSTAIAKKLLNFNTNIYGIDPDYFFSIVPLNGSYQKRTEKYILDLKSDRSLKCRVKRIIKKILISTGYSKALYESFVIVLQPIKH